MEALERLQVLPLWVGMVAIMAVVRAVLEQLLRVMVVALELTS